ncbi:MAG: L-lactate dehydrogenase [Candidatus Buchananbacteria bacterium RIFCSPHIGHO2_01_FULL_44_11]|uniref:L-lactate dehydrogenase n=1 Tax=Candidatus Buchananbacteria bacterium RIFCSPHIGHO2_01_FULL_44_11 TaxID=1797535 RepID=A0A1G1XZP8_9BACT|nr:MAG: L-lactate dehydrogenase [Candidatus Buchananbacteria bacterium RIFCSPHIGHO2_01_FULL_44_11]
MAQKKSKTESTRVVIIGTGSVGATTAFALMTQGIASEIVLIDRNKNKAQGEAKDLEQGLSFVPQAKVWAGGYADCRQADVIIITAGLAQKPGQTRLELTKTNGEIIKGIIKEIKRYTKDAIILVVTNPLDVMTYLASKESGFAAGRVLGSGTTLDSSRFRYYLAKKTGLAATSVGAYLLGEHGDSSVPVYSHVNVMGEPIGSLPGATKKAAVAAYKTARNAAYEVIAKKGATYYAIALAASRLVRAILYDENHVFPVSVLLKGEYGLKDVCLSVPAVIGRTGVKKIIKVKLNAAETKQLHRSAKIIQKAIADVKKK